MAEPGWLAAYGWLFASAIGAILGAGAVWLSYRDIHRRHWELANTLQERDAALTAAQEEASAARSGLQQSEARLEELLEGITLEVAEAGVLAKPSRNPDRAFSGSL